MKRHADSWRLSSVGVYPYVHASTVTIPYVIFTSGLVLTADCAEQLGYASLSRPFFLPPQVGKGSGLRVKLNRRINWIYWTVLIRQ